LLARIIYVSHDLRKQLYYLPLQQSVVGLLMVSQCVYCAVRPETLCVLHTKACLQEG